ncbi:MAG: hypothetical protein Q6362_003790 [Candidatus Wukongarchaeota archaeon]|nr:hypothetical protein [Candidatus Wukongarchaeota archaeon]
MNKSIVGSERIIPTQVGKNGYEGDDLRVINRKSKNVLGLTFCCICCERRCDEWLKKRKWFGNS